MSETVAPRAPRHAPVAPRQSKRSDFLTDQKDWAFSEPLHSLKDITEDEGAADPLLNSQSREAAADREANLLKVLRSEDWLVKGSMSDTFWEMPLAAKQTAHEHPDLKPLQEETLPTFEATTTPDLWPRLENLLGANENTTSVIENHDLRSGSFVDANADPTIQSTRSRRDSRSDQYRALLGLDVSSEPGSPLMSATARNPGFGSNPFAPAPLPAENPTSSSKQSLQPVMSAGASSLFPTAPKAPRRASVFDSLDAEQPPKSAPATTVSQPFYEPARRQF